MIVSNLIKNSMVNNVKTSDLKPKTWYTINNKLSYVSNTTITDIFTIEYHNNELRHVDFLPTEDLSIQIVDVPTFSVGDYVIITNIPNKIFGSIHIPAKMQHLKNKVCEIVEIDNFVASYIIEYDDYKYAFTPFDLIKIEL